MPPLSSTLLGMVFGISVSCCQLIVRKSIVEIATRPWTARQVSEVWRQAMRTGRTGDANVVGCCLTVVPACPPRRDTAWVLYLVSWCRMWNMILYNCENWRKQELSTVVPVRMDQGLRQLEKHLDEEVAKIYAQMGDFSHLVALGIATSIKFHPNSTRSRAKSI